MKEETPVDTAQDQQDEAGAAAPGAGEAAPEAGSGPGDDPGRSRGHRTTPEEVEEALAGADLSEAMDSLQSEFDELNDRHLRLAAEFTNYRRRAEAESLAVWGRAQADLVRRFLDVLDDLQRVSGLDPAEESVTVESIVEGIDLVERKFLAALREVGADMVSPAEGDAFDPETMEAMMRVPAQGDAGDDTVAQVFQKGYVVDGNLVRPARVSVYKAD